MGPTITSCSLAEENFGKEYIFYYKQIPPHGTSGIMPYKRTCYKTLNKFCTF